jgi:hypothetical protein
MRALDAPPYDGAGNVVPHDYAGIQPDDGIIRRVPEQSVVDDEKAVGGRRLSSMAFRASSGTNGGMSIDHQQQIEEAGLDPKKFVTTPRWVGSIRFVAASLREEGFKVGFDPTDENPYHGQVWGNFGKGKQRRLRELCEWFVPISDVSV